MATGYDGSIRINTKVNTSGFDTGVKSMTASLGKLAAAVGVAFSVTALVKLGQQAIELASGIQEVDNVVSKSFGNMRSEMDALADTAIEKLGMSRLTAYQTGSTFMAMGKSMLDSASEAKDMSLELTKLTGNMSSFYNVRQDVASTALKSIYTGETETLKQFGVVMTETNLQQFAFEQGMQKQIAAMTQSEKVTLRYKYVMEQLAFIGDDFTDTQDSWANQTRILSEQWKELLSVLGSGLITVLTPVVQGLNAIVSAMINAANTIGQFMSTVFGVEAQTFAIADAEEAYAGIAGSAEDAASATDEYGKSVEKAGKKARGALAAFDALSVLQSQETSGSSSTGTGNSIKATPIEMNTSMMDEVDEKLDKLKQRISELKELFIEGFERGFKTDKLSEVEDNLKRIQSAVGKIFSSNEVQESFNNLIDNTVAMLGTITGAAASTGISIADGITGGIAQALENESLQKLAEKKISSIADNISAGEEHISAFAESIAEISTAFESDAFKGIIDFFTQLAIVIVLEKLDAITGFFSDLVGFFTRPISENAEQWEKLLENIFELTNNLLKPLKDLLGIIENDSVKYQDSAFHKFMEALTGDAVQNVRNVLNIVNSGLERLIDLTSDLSLENVSEGLNNFVESVTGIDMEGLGESIESFFSMDIGEELQTGLENITACLDNVKAWFDGNVDMVAGWFENSVSPWFTAEKWDGLLFSIGQSLARSVADFRDIWTKDIPDWFEKDVKPWFSLDTWAELLTGIVTGFSQKLEEVKALWDESIGTWWEESVVPWFSLDTWAELLTGFIDGVKESFDEMKATWEENISKWWEESVAPWFTLKRWEELGENIKNGVYNGFKGIVTSVIDLLNNGIIAGFENMANRVIEAINNIIDGWNSLAPDLDLFQVSRFSTVQLGRIPYPKLAQGAVLEPNHPFLAWVGDQTSGKNIEAPANLIKDMVKEGLSESGILNMSRSSGGREIQLILEGEVVGRAILPHFLDEWKRGGYNIEILE